MNNYVLENETRDRRSYIGASDIAKIVGVSKYGTAVDVFLAKTAKDKLEKIKSLNFDIALLAETKIINKYQDDYGVTGGDFNVNAYLLDRPYIGCQLDYLSEDRKFIAEAKYFNYSRAVEFGDEWTSDVPLDVLYQVAMQSKVTGVDYVDIVVNFNHSNDIKIYRYEKDDEFEKNIFTIACDFWQNHVVPEISPDPRTLDDYKKLFPFSNGKGIKADFNAISLLEKRVLLKDEFSRLEKEMKTLLDANEIEIKRIFGENDSLIHDDKVIATLKTTHRKGFTVEPTSYRTIRIKL